MWVVMCAEITAALAHDVLAPRCFGLSLRVITVTKEEELGRFRRTVCCVLLPWACPLVRRFESPRLLESSLAAAHRGVPSYPTWSRRKAASILTWPLGVQRFSAASPDGVLISSSYSAPTSVA